MRALPSPTTLASVHPHRPKETDVEHRSDGRRKGAPAGGRQPDADARARCLDATVGAIAARAGRAPAQALLRWCVQRGVPALSKSTHRERIAENGEIFDFELSSEELAQLDALDRTGGTGNALESKWW